MPEVGDMMNTSNKAGIGEHSDFSQWENINWDEALRTVCYLQAQITEAQVRNEQNLIADLQHELTRSLAAKAIAVKLTVDSKGRNTPGIDRIHWNTDESKYQAIADLRPDMYSPKPYLRKYVPKANGKLRPLHIPSLADRAMQNLYKLALEPIAECVADSNSFGFRIGRRAQDAIAKCHDLLENGATWIIEGDIASCFDNISHDWLLANIPMERNILRKFLKCDIVEFVNHWPQYMPCRCGVSQGSPISPTLCNMTLNGIRMAAIKDDETADLIRYADDFVITSQNPKTMWKALAQTEAFLSQRGLMLSAEKTTVTSAERGFDFLGCTITKTHGSTKIQPSKKSIQRIMEKTQAEIANSKGRTPEQIIERLDLLIRGWTNYYQHYCCDEIFRQIDSYINFMLKKHNMPEIIEASIFRASETTKSEYEPINPNANPFDPTWYGYFEKRALPYDTSYAH